MQKSGIIIRIVDWLSRRRALNLALVFGYFIFIFLMHVPCARLSVLAEHSLSLPVYNRVVAGTSILLLALFCIFIIMQLKKNPSHRRHKLAYLLLVLSFIILHFNIMFEMNIEIIHVFQYSILALLLFPLSRRFGAAVCFAIPFMLTDEWNQYINLYPGYVQYFEFNDVILDINGCGLAMVALYISGVSGAAKPLMRRPELAGVLVFAALVLFAFKTCFIALYAVDRCPGTWLVLNIVPEPPSFWRKFPGRDVVYHIMQPLEAILAIISLAFFYMGLDRVEEAEK